MSIRNQNWYNLQSTRRYPLDENSTGLDDTGAFIRDDILVDCHIRFPNTYGKYVYVQGLTVSPGIVTVVLGVSQTLDNADSTPLAFVSVVQPVEQHINYEITGLKSGVSGWVTFGPGIETNFVGRYSLARQSFVAPRCARAYKPLPVPTVGKFGLQDALQGVVRILGALPVRVRYDENAGDVVKSVAGVKTPYKDNVSALVIELDPTQITKDYNPLRIFLGPCAQRPESGTCAKPPIESINGITPDCAGNINIVFENFNSVRPFADCGGIDIVSNDDLTAICDAANPGQRRTYRDDCCAVDLEVDTENDLIGIPMSQRTAQMTVKTKDTNELWRLADNLLTWTSAESAEYCSWPDPTTAIPDVVIDETTPDPTYPSVAIPACVDFSTCNGATLFTTRLGAFVVRPAVAPEACPSCASADLTPDNINHNGPALTVKNVYAAQNSAAVNMATFNNSATDWALNKTISVELLIESSGLDRVGGLVLNYQKLIAMAGQTTAHQTQFVETIFVAPVLDAGRGQLRVLRYSNNAVTVEGAAPMRIKTGSWYRLSATPIFNGDTVAVSVYAEEVTGNNLDAANMVVQISTGLYGPFIGSAGIIASRSAVKFNKFTIIE